MCKLLIEGELSVTEVYFLSGFNNVSYFNRQFRAFKKATPGFPACLMGQGESPA